MYSRSNGAHLSFMESNHRSSYRKTGAASREHRCRQPIHGQCGTKRIDERYGPETNLQISEPSRDEVRIGRYTWGAVWPSSAIGNYTADQS